MFSLHILTSFLLPQQRSITKCHSSHGYWSHAGVLIAHLVARSPHLTHTCVPVNYEHLSRDMDELLKCRAVHFILFFISSALSHWIFPFLIFLIFHVHRILYIYIYTYLCEVLVILVIICHWCRFSVKSWCYWETLQLQSNILIKGMFRVFQILPLASKNKRAKLSQYSIVQFTAVWALIWTQGSTFHIHKYGFGLAVFNQKTCQNQVALCCSGKPPGLTPKKVQVQTPELTKGVFLCGVCFFSCVD